MMEMKIGSLGNPIAWDLCHLCCCLGTIWNLTPQRRPPLALISKSEPYRPNRPQVFVYLSSASPLMPYQPVCRSGQESNRHFNMHPPRPVAPWNIRAMFQDIGHRQRMNDSPTGAVAGSNKAPTPEAVDQTASSRHRWAAFAVLLSKCHFVLTTSWLGHDNELEGEPTGTCQLLQLRRGCGWGSRGLTSFVLGSISTRSNPRPRRPNGLRAGLVGWRIWAELECYWRKTAPLGEVTAL